MIVGKPLALLLMQKNEKANATVTVVHSRSRDLAEITPRPTSSFRQLVALDLSKPITCAKAPSSSMLALIAWKTQRWSVVIAWWAMSHLMKYQKKRARSRQFRAAWGR